MVILVIIFVCVDKQIILKEEKKMKKYAYFAFNGNAMCFVHVLLNALDMHEKGYESLIVFEGEAVKLIKDMDESKNPLFAKVKYLGLFHAVCKACSAKMGVLEYNETCGIPLAGEMNGHPAMEVYLGKGYEIITL